MATVADEPKTGLNRELFEPDWFLTDEQKRLRERLIEICEKEIRPRAAANDRDLIFPRESLEALAPDGFLGLMLPQGDGRAAARTTSCTTWSPRRSRATAMPPAPCAT